MTQSYILEQTIELLNEAVKADPEAVAKLIAARVPCNDMLATHPTIQVTDYPHTVGILGIINGIVDRLTLDRVAVEIDDNGKVVRFVQYQKPSVA